MIKKSLSFMVILFCFNCFLLFPIKVISPNGGRLVFGSRMEIKWALEGATHSIRLLIIKGNQKRIIVARLAPGTTSYWWDVGHFRAGSVRADSGYKIRVKEQNGGPFDESDAPFEILPGTLNIKTPRGGTLIQGETYPITWEKVGNIPDTCFSLYLFRGHTRYAVIESCVCDTRYRWTVSPEYVTGSNFHVEILSQHEIAHGKGKTFSIQSIKPDLTVRRQGRQVKLNRHPALKLLTYEAIIDNNGYGEAGPSVARLRIYNNANRIEKTLTKNVEKIAAGGQKKIRFEYSLHRYAPFKNELTVDYRGAVEEGNEQNNSDQYFYRTPRLPDLVVCARTPRQVRILQPSPILFTVKNIGAIAAPASRLEMNIENRQPRYFDIGPLEPGHSITKQYASTWYRKGTRKFDITIDYRNKIQEYSENNTFYGKIIKISVHSTPRHGSEKCSGYLNNATEGR